MFKSRVTAKYNVVDSVWYHGRAATNPSFDLELVGKGNDEQGPAFYFTSDIKDATGYAYPSGIVITAQVKPKKLVEGKAKAAEVEKLIRKSPVFHDALSNYDENPGTAFRIAFKGIMDQGSALDSFLSVWYEFYRYHPRAYLENIVELGYDGHLVPRQGGVQHLMIYNPKVIKVLEETPYSEVQAEVKPIEHFSTFEEGNKKHWSLQSDQTHGIKGLVKIARMELENPRLAKEGKPYGGEDLFHGSKEAVREHAFKAFPGTTRVKFV